MTSPENPDETGITETHEEEEDVLDDEEEELEVLEDERLEQSENHCAICQENFKDPRILNCLHVFCRDCLEKQLAESQARAEEENDGQQNGEEGCGKPSTEGEQGPMYIECKTCKDVFRLPKNGIEDLQIEHVLLAILNMSSVSDLSIVCTSCKAKEKATARCNDCVSFLCPNCVTAHQFMRCFENHQVRGIAKLPHYPFLKENYIKIILHAYL